MTLSVNDAHHLERALALARAGTGLCSPNPQVGAVVVDPAGKVAGEGSHTYTGVKHAEVLALAVAGDRARGGTLYINLEPCSHQGRTPPCADAVIAAGIARVVGAMQDPNPRVAGAGFARLRAAGIEVVVAEGVMAAHARRLNEAFAKFIREGTPLVTLKAGMTLDGKIALPGSEHNPAALAASGGSATYITSKEARQHVHVLRHAADAIMVGVGTVLADDPLLTDRSGKARRRPLLRVIIDSRLRMPLDAKLVKTASQDVLVVCAFAEARKKRELEERGVSVEQILPASYAHVVGASAIHSSEGRPDLRAVVQRLGKLEITSLLIEGGALINWAALAAGIVDKVFLYYAPRIFGGTGAVPFASGEGYRQLADAATVHDIALHRFGEDFAVEGYLHDPYRPGEPAVADNLRVMGERG